MDMSTNNTKRPVTRELVDKLNQIASSSLYISYCENYIKTVDELYRRCTKQKSMNKIKNVIFNNPATIVFWSDGSKTVVKCGEGDTFDPEKGLAMAISKKFFDNKGYYCDIFKKWLPKKEEKTTPKPIAKVVSIDEKDGGVMITCELTKKDE